MSSVEYAKPHVELIWPKNFGHAELAFGWNEMACGVNSGGSQPVYGPFPRLPRVELGEQTGEFCETRFRAWRAQTRPFGVRVIHVCRRFQLTEPTPGVLEWAEIT
jgi:hypothetical protein